MPTAERIIGVCAAQLSSFSPTYIAPNDATPRLTLVGTALRASYNVVLTQGVGCGGVGAASDVNVSEIGVDGAFGTLTTDVGAGGLAPDTKWTVCVALYAGSPWYAASAVQLVVRCVCSRAVIHLVPSTMAATLVLTSVAGALAASMVSFHTSFEADMLPALTPSAVVTVVGTNLRVSNLVRLEPGTTCTVAGAGYLLSSLSVNGSSTELAARVDNAPGATTVCDAMFIA